MACRNRDLYAGLLRDQLEESEAAAFLVWGDPMLYDSTLRILERVRGLDAVSFAVTVVPGITSIQALAASHAIPLNAIGQPVTITTGRRLTETFPDPAGTAVVMLDGEQAFLALTDPEVTIYWGAYLGLPQTGHHRRQARPRARGDRRTACRVARRPWLDHGYLPASPNRCGAWRRGLNLHVGPAMA